MDLGGFIVIVYLRLVGLFVAGIIWLLLFGLLYSVNSVVCDSLIVYVIFSLFYLIFRACFIVRVLFCVCDCVSVVGLVVNLYLLLGLICLFTWCLFVLLD